MPYLFVIVGVVMLTAAARNSIADQGDTKGLTHLLRDDFTGKGNFLYWVLSIMVVGALGYIKPLQPVSRAFMLLIVIVLVLSNKGIFQQFNAALKGTQANIKDTPIPLINLGAQWSGGSDTTLPIYNPTQ